MLALHTHIDDRRKPITALEPNALIIAYIALATLLLGFNLYSSWHWLVKITANAVMIVFFVVTYHAWPSMLGWPTDRDLPSHFYLHAVMVDEPDNIYLWGGEIENGLAQVVPRAYRLSYTAAMHDKVDKATRKLRKGLPVIGLVSSNPSAEVDLTNLEQIRSKGQQIEFIDAPQGLIPGKN